MAVERLRESAARFRDLVQEGPEAVGKVSKPAEIAAEMVGLLGLLLNMVAGAALALFSKPRRQKFQNRGAFSLRKREAPKESSL